MLLISILLLFITDHKAMSGRVLFLPSTLHPSHPYVMSHLANELVTRGHHIEWMEVAPKEVWEPYVNYFSFIRIDARTNQNLESIVHFTWYWTKLLARKKFGVQKLKKINLPYQWRKITQNFDFGRVKLLRIVFCLSYSVFSSCDLVWTIDYIIRVREQNLNRSEFKMIVYIP